MGVLKAKIDGNWVPLEYSGGPNPQNALGVIAMASALTTSALPISTDTVLGTLNVTTYVGRRYRFSYWLTSARTAAQLIMYFKKNGAQTLGGWFYANSGWGGTTFTMPWNGDDSTATWTLTINPGTTANVTINEGWFVIEDIGPTAAPALPLPATPPVWTPLTLTNGWVNYGGGYVGAAIQRVGDRRYMRGLLTATNATANACTTLAIGDRPPSTEMFPSVVYHSAAERMGRIDILANGEVRCLNTLIPGVNNYFALTSNWSVTP